MSLCGCCFWSDGNQHTPLVDDVTIREPDANDHLDSNVEGSELGKPAVPMAFNEIDMRDRDAGK